jgi:predicted TIM-barrel fold metal-dependent hydrolase
MHTFVRQGGLAAAVMCFVICAGCSRTAQEPPAKATSDGKTVAVKYGVYVESGPMDSVLLKDYQPESSLVVPETSVAKARFPAIDVHAHSLMNNVKTAGDVAEWVRVMDEVGIDRTVVFTDAIGEEFDRQADLFLKPYPGRFLLFCSLDTSDPGAPGYSERAVRELVRCHQKGARGVGELSDKGWGLQGGMAALNVGGRKEAPLPRDKRLHPDDPRLDPVWQKCAELKMAVNYHIADHPSCWRPLGPQQERTPDFQHFNLVGKDVPSYEELLAMRDRMLAKHPRTTFVVAHLGNQGNDLASFGKALDRYPNLYADIAARDYELGRQPRNALRFLTRYKDRILFGTDMGREKSMYQGWWRLLESDDEYLPGRIWWRQYGLSLPAPILRSLYRENALRILNWKGAES